MSGTLLTEGIQGTAPSGSPALGGLRVLEISASDSFAASLLAMLLADQGAAVVKVGLDHAHAPVEDERARTTSGEARARAGIDRNKNVLEPLASASEIERLAALADVVILPYDTGITELDPVGLRERYPSLLVVTMCEFDELGVRPPDDGTVGAATGLFTDMNIYDRLFEPGHARYTMAPLRSVYAAVHGAAAVCLALLRRASTGSGDRIRVSLAGSFMQAQGVNLVKGWPGNEPVPGWFRKIVSLGLQDRVARMAARGSDPFARKYDCLDGPSTLEVLCSSSWKLPPRMIREMGLWDEAAKDVGIVDSDFGRGKKLGWRKKRGMTKLLEREIAKDTSQHWTETLGPVVPVTTRRSTEDWFDQPFVRETDLRVDIDDPLAGAVGVPGRLVTVDAAGSIEPRKLVADVDAVSAVWQDAAPFTLDNEGPLAGGGGLANGLRVLDLTTVVAAPYCGVTLAQYGADVTRIAAPEPNHEDMIELTAGADVQRGKQNIVVDLTTDAGQQLLAELVAETDVVVCNMRPGPASKLNVDADSIHALRPEAIYCRISAFPGSDWPGYDPLLQQASGVVDAYTRESRSGLGNWLGLAGSIDYGGGASGLFAIALGLIAQARGTSADASVAASLAHFAQLIQSDRIVTGASLPPVPVAPMPLSRAEHGRWQYTPATSGSEAPSTKPVVTLASLRANAHPVADEQVGAPCQPEFSATSVVRQKQHDGSSDHHPAPTHVRFEQANDPIIISAAVLDGSDPDS
jgi:crotonobetainyl-CoA:carnitine CoA-transferase CaiB-like acyl-CoA transferase